MSTVESKPKRKNKIKTGKKLSIKTTLHVSHVLFVAAHGLSA